MKLYTIQNGKYRKAKGQFVDVTAKSGVIYFAPSWELVLGIKNNRMTWEEYTSCYTEMMRESFKEKQLVWLKLFDFEEVTIGCYCPSGSNCHRYLLIDMFKKIADRYNYKFEYCGEIE